MKKQVFHYNIILRPEPEGGFTVVVPALPGCITYGKNLEEAKKMAYDAVDAYLSSAKKHGEIVFSDKDSLFATLEIVHA
ncbi:MAG: type II toxin-antitoxin system HicB family antitoxin [Candidatus Pacebacteria bacterium]|nr:type II toxin-antitoxin system HicB family antitoxin [Candidatus Paceibacterota bacterium]